MTQQYQGQCHCGAIKFSFAGDAIEHGLRCNCSMCERRGAVMTPFAIPPAEFNIDAKEGELGCYTFGAETAKHYFCKTCGIYPFHQTARQPEHYRANIGCIDSIDSYELPIEVFDGKHLF